MCIDETRWMMYHFDGDPIERESIRLTTEILKTLVIIVFGVYVVLIVKGISLMF